MAQFFTGEATEMMKFSSSVVIILNIVLVLGSALTILLARKSENATKIFKIMSVILLFEFASINTWYWVSGFTLSPWPFYHCRIAKVFLPLIILFDAKEKMKPLYLYVAIMGFVGAISTFMVLIPDPFQWPHITIVSYFLGHLLLMFIALGTMMQEQKPWTMQDFGKAQIILLIFNLIFWMFARITKFNYSYFLSPPLFQKQLGGLPPLMLGILVIIAHAILFAVGFYLITLLKKALQPKSRKVIA